MIKKLTKISFLALLLAVFLMGGNKAYAVNANPAPIPLGVSGNYVILGKTTVTTTGVTAITGDVGLSPAAASFFTGFSQVLDGGGAFSVSSLVTGRMFASDYAGGTTAADLTTATTNMSTAYTNGAGRSPVDIVSNPGTNVDPRDLVGLNLGRGVYKIDSPVNATITGTLTLTGNATDVWIFQIAGTLNVHGNVTLAGTARPENVFWVVAGQTTIFPGAQMKGIILDQTGIAMQSGASINGRLLAQTAVTLIANTVTQPVAPSSIKAITVFDFNGLTPVVTGVVNESAKTVALTVPYGTAVTALVPTITITGASVSPLSSVAANFTTPQTYTVTAADDSTQAYVVTVTVAANPNKDITAFSFPEGTGVITGTDIAVTIPSGTAVTALVPTITITGASISPLSSVAANFTSPVIYTVTAADASTKAYTVTVTVTPPPSGGGGSYTPPVPPLINILKVPNPLALPLGPGRVTYTYTVTNIGTVPMTGVTLVGDTCRLISFVSGDTNRDRKLDVSETWKYTCAKTLSTSNTNTVRVTGYANGLSATHVAQATVVVGVPLISPLINVVKIPIPLTLPLGGGSVTYRYTVTNPGTAPLSNVSITDDKCTGLPGRVIGHPGDINKNDLLESNEKWSFICNSNITTTTTNTATATGQADGFTVTDIAYATVVVADSKLSIATPGVSNGYAFGAILVKQGSKGGACKAWQTFLNANGANLSTDGACGKLTMAAARSWQASVALMTDGLLGAKSRAKAMKQ